MELRGLVSAHLPLAVIASIVIALADVLAGDISTFAALLTEFGLHVLAIFVGFAVVDAAWNQVFGESEG